MSVAVVFKCEFCGDSPGRETQANLERQLLDLRHGEYVDVEPERWLVWHGRRDLRADALRVREPPGRAQGGLREHYGTIGWHPWAKGPHPWRGRRGTDRARALKRGVSSSFGP